MLTFSFSRESGEKSEKCTQCGSRPEFLTGVHRRGVRVVIWAPTNLANRGGKAEKQADAHAGSHDDPVADIAEKQNS